MEDIPKRANLERFIRSFSDEESFDPQLEIEEQPPKAELWREIDQFVFPEDPWLIPNVFPREGISIIASMSGEGKSQIALHLGECLTEGKEWFGHAAFKAKKSRVLYVNLEMSMSEIQRRGRKIGFNPANENLVIVNADDFNLNESGEEPEDKKYKWLLRYIYDNQIDVVIIDTFRASAGGLKEEKAEEVRAYFQKFQILKNSGVSLIFLEHLRKPSQLEGKIPKKEQLLGSQDKTANVEILLMIRKDESTGNVHMYQRKNRLGVEIKPFAFSIKDFTDADGKERMGFEYVGEVEEDVNKKEAAKQLIMDILASGDMKDRKELGELMRKQVGDKNRRAALKDLLNDGDIDFVKKGHKHVYFIPKTAESTPLVPEKDTFLQTDEIF